MLHEEPPPRLAAVVVAVVVDLEVVAFVVDVVVVVVSARWRCHLLEYIGAHGMINNRAGGSRGLQAKQTEDTRANKKKLNFIIHYARQGLFP